MSPEDNTDLENAGMENGRLDERSWWKPWSVSNAVVKGLNLIWWEIDSYHLHGGLDKLNRPMKWPPGSTTITKVISHLYILLQSRNYITKKKQEPNQSHNVNLKRPPQHFRMLTNVAFSFNTYDGRERPMSEQQRQCVCGRQRGAWWTEVQRWFLHWCSCPPHTYTHARTHTHTHIQCWKIIDW